MTRFDQLPKEEHRRFSSKGGKKKRKTKGFASLSEEERKANAQRAAAARWAKQKNKV